MYQEFTLPLFSLDALDPNAYEAFQASRDLKDVVERVLELQEANKSGLTKKLSIKACLMTPVLPMLVSGEEEEGRRYSRLS